MNSDEYDLDQLNPGLKLYHSVVTQISGFS